MKVAILAGGRSSEHDVSLKSAAAVRDGLHRGNHETVWVLLGRDGSWTTEDGEPVALTPGGGLLGCDVAFPALHGPFGEDGTVQGLLELLDVPYVGSGVLASAACIDKIVFKDLMRAAGIPQVDYAGVHHAQWRDDREQVLADLERLGTPVFVKPARLGSSVGIVKVSEPAELAGALDEAFTHDPRVVVEAMATGLEIECSVLGTPEEPEVSTPGEIELLGDADWYDYEAKYADGGMNLVVPARITEEQTKKLQELAKEAFTRANCFGLARADFFVDGDEILVNELNTMPGFTATSVYGKLWIASGLAYADLVEDLCRLAMARAQAAKAYRF
ncbi:MAG: D-alanine--D-alanine ligase [Solirubrobacteraceae bacterium]|nr:D-alanine--D-alanine ligase [Solirubrobacteraceae bacterium]